MKRLRFIFAMLFLFVTVSFAQNEDEQIRAVGDSLVGRNINGESIREIYGHVIMTQGNVKITCEKAIQYIAKNEAELIGKVVVTQDTLVIKTDRGYYYGNTKTSYSNIGLFLTDGHYSLTAKNGYYYFDEKRSYFYDNVKMKDSLSTLVADRLNYYSGEDKAVAVSNVRISDTTSTIFADSLIHLRKIKDTYAFNNIRIYDPSNHLAIYGNYLEDFGQKKYSKITGNPFLVRLDTTSTGELDTLMISSKVMESFSDSTKKMIVTDSVKIIRGTLASINNQTFYYKNGDKVQTYRRESDQIPPIIWNEKTQLVGDSVNIFMKKNQLDWMEVKSSASIITINQDSLFRYDQMSGKNIKLFFDNGKLSRSEVTGNVLSIYYMLEDNEPNGLLKSSSERAKILFKDKAVNDVRLYGKPVSEYHPENMIKGKEKDFTIPTFKIYNNKPTKENLLLNRKDILLYLIKDMQYYAGKPNPKK
jgi:lipopolysaccharide export system protein LptA